MFLHSCGHGVVGNWNTISVSDAKGKTTKKSEGSAALLLRAENKPNQFQYVRIVFVMSKNSNAAMEARGSMSCPFGDWCRLRILVTVVSRITHAQLLNCSLLLIWSALGTFADNTSQGRENTHPRFLYRVLNSLHHGCLSYNSPQAQNTWKKNNNTNSQLKTKTHTQKQKKLNKTEKTNTETKQQQKGLSTCLFICFGALTFAIVKFYFLFSKRTVEDLRKLDCSTSFTIHEIRQ